MRRKLQALFALLLVWFIAFSAPSLALAPEDFDDAAPQNLAEADLYAEAAVLLDADSGNVLFGKNARVRMNPASTTKIMTLLLAIESGYDLNQQIAIPQAAADIEKGSSLVPVFPGETMSFGDLLTGFFLNSGNDGANAVAVIVAGTIDNFVAMMNRRAAEIGCLDTHFANPHGLTADGHYTTAYDMALIAREAMKNEAFANIARLPRAVIHVNERGDITVGAKRDLLAEGSQYYYTGCVGVKSGFTSAAGRCYVGAAERNGALLISVVFKCETETQPWVDTTRIFNYGWTCYESYTLDQMYEVARSQIASVVISNASEDDPFSGRLDLDIAQISNTDYLRMVEKNNESALPAAVADFISRTQVEITHDLTAPISMGEIIGNFSYFDATAGNVVTAKLVAGRDVQERVVRAQLTDVFPFLKIFGNRIFLLLLAVLIVLVLLIIVLSISRRRARQRRRRKIYEQRRAEYLRRQRAQEAHRRRSPPPRSRDSRRPR